MKLISQNMVNKKFTGSFTHNDLNVALRSICDPLQIEFTIEGEEVTLHAKKNN
ncbi:MAG: FecR domain-containing protein [Bacteroidota bacterium]